MHSSTRPGSLWASAARTYCTVSTPVTMSMPQACFSAPALGKVATIHRAAHRDACELLHSPRRIYWTSTVPLTMSMPHAYVTWPALGNVTSIATASLSGSGFSIF